MQASPHGQPLMHRSCLTWQVSEQSIHESPQRHPFVHCGPDRVGDRGAEPLHCRTEIPVTASATAAITAAIVRFCLVDRAGLGSIIGEPPAPGRQRVACRR